MRPIPPCCASAIAKCDSVTVSMAALATGMFRAMWRVIQVRVSTCAGTTSLRAGRRRMSSNVRPSGMVSGTIVNYTAGLYSSPANASDTLEHPHMISAKQLRPGMVIKFNNELYSIFKMEHRTPGNLRGFVQVKMRNFRSGTMMEHRFSSEDRVEKASLDEQEMEYLYDDGEYFYFMNTTTFEQMHLIKDLLGDATDFLIPNLKVHVEFYE